jgi:hypothetical protein
MPKYGGLIGSDRGAALAAVARLRHVHCCAGAPGWSLADGRVYATVKLPGRTRSRGVLNVSCLGTSTAAAPVAVGAAVGMGLAESVATEVCWLSSGRKFAAKSLKSPTANFPSYISLHF